MRIGVMPCKSASRALTVLFGSLILFLLACSSASAQEENVAWVGGSLYNYAEFAFPVPEEIEDQVEAISIGENNYSEGRYVEASLLFNESMVYILLLYPCDILGGELDDTGLKSAIEGFNPVMNQTNYVNTSLSISDRLAIGGQAPPQLGDFAFYAYQPSNQTISMIFFDLNVTEDFLEYFPEFLQINVSESTSPLWPGYCGEEVSDVEIPAEAEVQLEQTEQIVQTEETAATDQGLGQTNQTNQRDKEQIEANLAAVREGLKNLGASF